MIIQYEDLSDEQKADFDRTMKAAEDKEIAFYLERGMTHPEIMSAGLDYKTYLENEQRFYTKRPFDKAPGFRRLFILGWFYGRKK